MFQPPVVVYAINDRITHKERIFHIRTSESLFISSRMRPSECDAHIKIRHEILVLISMCYVILEAISHILKNENWYETLDTIVVRRITSTLKPLI